MKLKPKVCGAIGEDGKQCQGIAILGDFCISHTPELSEEADLVTFLNYTKALLKELDKYY